MGGFTGMKRFLLLFSLCLFLSPAAEANQIAEIRALGFGAFTITDIGSTHSIVITPNGATSTPDGGIHRLRGGNNATFRITQLNPATLFYITIDPTTIIHGSGAPSFIVDSFTFDPPNDINNMIHTDPDASLLVNIGATLHTPAGTPHSAGAYRGTYTFMINY
jgi:hypothetical protein